MNSHSEFDAANLPLRTGLATECERAWQRLAEPGSWWDGSERLAIAAQVRATAACALCHERKAALSPYASAERHSAAGLLSPAAVDVIHRVATDAGRLTRRWFDSIVGKEISEEQYVEIVGVVAVVTALDRFDQALGLPLRPLPAPQPGAANRHRPVGARHGLAWVATVAPEDLTANDPDPYSVHGSKNIHRALSLVPQEVLNFFDLDVELYLNDDEIRDFDHEYRA